MSDLYVWAYGEELPLPVKLLAVIGAFSLGGLLGGWALAVVAKLAFNQKVPGWLAWTMRLVVGVSVGYLAWMMLGVNLGPGKGPGDGKGKDKGSIGEKGTDKAGKPDETPQPITPPRDKEPEGKGRPDGPGIGSGESIRVEVLGDGPLEKLAGSGKMDRERRYRVADAPGGLRTLAEIKRLILQRRSQTPPLRKLDVVIYADSPDKASPSVKDLVDWAEDLDPGDAGPLVVEPKFPTGGAPLR